MANCWERAVLLAFRLCCFTLCCLNCLYRYSFPLWRRGQQDVELDYIACTKITAIISSKLLYSLGEIRSEPVQIPLFID